MIARVWKGLIRAEDADAYAAYVNDTGVAEFETTPGNRGSLTLHRITGETAEFVVISFWESRAAIEQFAGEQIERARFYPEDDRYLLERDFYASHYVVAGQTPSVGAEPS